MSGTVGGESVIIKEFLASFGYRIDESAQRKFNDAITGMTKTVEGLGAGLIGMATTLGNVIASTADRMFQLNVTLKNIGTTGGGETAQGLTAVGRALRELYGITPQQTQAWEQGAANILQHNPRILALLDGLVGPQGTLSDKLERLGQKYGQMSPNERSVWISNSPLAGLLPQEMRTAFADPKFAEVLKRNQEEMARTGTNLDQLTAAAQANNEVVSRLKSTWEDFANSLTAHALPGIDKDLNSLNSKLRELIPGFSKLLDEFNQFASSHPMVQHAETGAYVAGQIFSAQSEPMQIVEALLAAPLLKRLFGGLIGGTARGGLGLLRLLGLGGASLARGGIGLLGGLFGGGAAAAEGVGAAGAAEGGAGLLAALGPIGWTLLGLGAAGAGGYVLYRYLHRDQDQQSGPGGAPNRQGFFTWLWTSLVGTAHAEELPDNVKHLSDNVGELNQTMNDLLDQQFPGWRGSQGGGTPGIWGGKALAPGVQSAGFQNVLKAAGLDPTMAAFMSLLASPESGGAFDIKNGGARFLGFNAFPEGVAPGGTSSAAGAWQDVSSTWHGIEKLTGLRGFDPTTQAKGNAFWAAKVYQIATGRDLEADLRAGGHEAQIAAALHGQWPSLTAGNIHMGMMRNPDQFGGGGRNVNVNQNVTNNISGVSDPHAAGRELKTVQDHAHAQLVNSFNVALR